MAIEILTFRRIVWGTRLKNDQDRSANAETDFEGRQGTRRLGVWLGHSQRSPGPFAEQAIAQAGYQQYPNGNFPLTVTATRISAWKIVRGDTDFDSDRKPYRDREGYAGHNIIAVSTQSVLPARL